MACKKGMSHDATPVSELHVRANNGIRTYFNIRPKLGGLVNDGGGVNHGDCAF